MTTITKKGYAKINLFLDISARHNDGYHEVSTVMQTISLADEIKISLNDTDKIELLCDSTSIPRDERNIAYRAAELFFAESKIKAGITMEIVKQIPVSAGLGGGSADAAAVFVGLNEIFGNPMYEAELLRISSKLGADVPFCINKGTAFANGRGDKIYPIEPLFDCYFVVARGGEGISTPFAYGELDKKYNNFEGGVYIPHDVEIIKNAIISKDTNRFFEGMYNIFEEAVFPSRPIARKIKGELLLNSARAAMMSGSGTAVYGVFDDIKKAQMAADELKKQGYFAVVATPVNES